MWCSNARAAKWLSKHIGQTGLDGFKRKTTTNCSEKGLSFHIALFHFPFDDRELRRARCHVHDPDTSTRWERYRNESTRRTAAMEFKALFFPSIVYDWCDRLIAYDQSCLYWIYLIRLQCRFWLSCGLNYRMNEKCAESIVWRRQESIKKPSFDSCAKHSQQW